MNEKALIALISSLSAIGGGIVVGLASIIASKISADREDRRRREEIERRTARKRLENLYKPLLEIMEPGPPYDEFYLDHETQNRVIDKVEKNEIYASHDLLEVFWRFRYAYYNNPDEIRKGLDTKIFHVVISEHNRLKEVIGYGRIVKKQSILKSLLEKIKPYIEQKWREIRLNRFVRKVKRRKVRRTE